LVKGHQILKYLKGTLRYILSILGWKWIWRVYQCKLGWW
jgi:hypothetical protein